MSTLKANNISSKAAATDLNIQINASTVGTFDGTSGLLDQIKLIQQTSNLITTYTSNAASIPADGTNPQNTEGTELLTQSFTPLLSTSTIEIHFTGYATVNNDYGCFALFKDSDASAIACATTLGTSTTSVNTYSFIYRESSASTSARTYKIRYGSSSGGVTMYVNGNATNDMYGGLLKTGIVIYELV